MVSSFTSCNNYYFPEEKNEHIIYTHLEKMASDTRLLCGFEFPTTFHFYFISYFLRQKARFGDKAVLKKKI